MYKLMNNPYLRFSPYMEADKGGGAGGSDTDGEDTGGDDQDDDESDEGGEDDQEEKKFSQKDVDDAVQKRLAREKRKWQREQQKSKSDTKPNDKDEPPKDSEGESEADKKARRAEERAASLEMKWTCLEHEVKKDCVDDVLALAKVHMVKDADMDIDDAIDAVLKKYPQFKEGYESDGGDDDNSQGKKGWGQRQGKSQKKTSTVDDEIRKQMFGK